MSGLFLGASLINLSCSSLEPQTLLQQTRIRLDFFCDVSEAAAGASACLEGQKEKHVKSLHT